MQAAILFNDDGEPILYESCALAREAAALTVRRYKDNPRVWRRPVAVVRVTGYRAAAS